MGWEPSHSNLARAQRKMCGIAAILLANTADHCRQEVYDALTVLQHRGQDACGMVTAETRRGGSIKFNMVKRVGMVKDVFQQADMKQLPGNVGIGHVRYPTAGSKSRCQEAQPMYSSYPCGMALAHNGNLTNANHLARELEAEHRHLNTNSDSEVLMGVISEELQRAMEAETPSSPGGRVEKISAGIVLTAVRNVMNRCKGGYAVVLLIHNLGVVSFRDPWGIRPLVCGRRESKTLAGGMDYISTSETVAIDVMGFETIGDVNPGQVVMHLPMTPGSPREDCGMIVEQCVPAGETWHRPCLFEYVYFARQDSVIDGVLAYQCRQNMGTKMALELKSSGLDQMIDIVCPVPETSCVGACSCAVELGKPYVEALVKNRYVGRTFIMPGQEMRRKSVRMKLNPIKSLLRGKSVPFVDDSIVRGTTVKEIVAMARDAGASKVYFASISPKIVHPNVYGIDLPNKEELFAYNRTDEQMAEFLGADGVHFLSLNDLQDSITECNPALTAFEASVFNGEYVTGDIDDAFFATMAEEAQL